MNLFRRKTRQEERRAHFRRRVPSDAFEAILKNKAGESFLVGISDISLGGATVRVPTACGYTFAPEEEVILDLVVSHPGRLIHISASVRRVDDQGLHLQFLSPKLDDMELDAESRMLLSRRKYPRFSLREHVRVELTIGSVVVNGQLVDLSEGGMGVRLTEELAGRLAVDQRVEACFVVPGSLSPTTVFARVKHRTPHAGKLLFGLEFETERSDELNHVIEFLAKPQA